MATPCAASMSSAVSTLEPKFVPGSMLPFSRMLIRWSPATVCVEHELGVVGELPVATQDGSTVISWSPVLVANAVIAGCFSGAVQSVKPSVWPVPSNPCPVML